jgi:hypothetical protein
MSLLEHAVLAYNLVLYLVQAMLEAVFGDVYGLTAMGLLVAALVAGGILLLRRRAGRSAKE